MEFYGSFRLEKIDGLLLELECFELADESDAILHRIYRHSFVDEVKSNGQKKSRFFVAPFNVKKDGMLTAA